MKKLLCGILATLSIIAFLLCGCSSKDSGPSKYSDPWDYKQEEAGFYYYLVAEDGHIARKGHAAVSATILGLVDEEKEIDNLVIPEKLGGYLVNKIGTQTGGMYGNSKTYGINAHNIKKVILNKAVFIPRLGVGSSTNYGIYNFDGMVITNFNVTDTDMLDYSSFLTTHNVQFNEEIDLSILSSHIYKKVKSIVAYDSCGGKQKTYACINQISEYLIEPELPTKEGYMFDGWFTEDYQKEWNFEEDKITEEMTVITLYAKWIKR